MGLQAELFGVLWVGVFRVVAPVIAGLVGRTAATTAARTAATGGARAAASGGARAAGSRAAGGAARSTAGGMSKGELAGELMGAFSMAPGSSTTSTGGGNPNAPNGGVPPQGYAPPPPSPVQGNSTGTRMGNAGVGIAHTLASPLMGGSNPSWTIDFTNKLQKGVVKALSGGMKEIAGVIKNPLKLVGMGGRDGPGCQGPKV